MTLPMWFCMLTTPVLMLWPEYHDAFYIELWIVDVAWLIDLIFNFFKANNELDVTYW
jgi:hypothetical protein